MAQLDPRLFQSMPYGGGGGGSPPFNPYQKPRLAPPPGVLAALSRGLTSQQLPPSLYAGGMQSPPFNPGGGGTQTPPFFPQAGGVGARLPPQLSPHGGGGTQTPPFFPQAGGTQTPPYLPQRGGGGTRTPPFNPYRPRVPGRKPAETVGGGRHYLPQGRSGQDETTSPAMPRRLRQLVSRGRVRPQVARQAMMLRKPRRRPQRGRPTFAAPTGGVQQAKPNEEY